MLQCKRLTLSIFALAAALASSGCTNIDVYRNPLLDLTEATTTTRAAMNSLARSVNRAKVEGEAQRAVSQGTRFGDNELAPIVSRDFQDARDQGLALIENLGRRALQVVDANDGTEAAKDVAHAGERAAALAKRLEKTAAARYAGPVGDLATTILAMYDQATREEILKKALLDGLPAARRILNELQDDLALNSSTNLVGTLREELVTLKTERISALDQLLVEQDKEPGMKSSAIAAQARAAYVAEIVRCNEAIEALDTSSLAGAVAELDGTLEKLAATLNDHFSPRSFAAFVTQLAVFSERAIMLIEAANEVNAAIKGRN